MAQFEEIILRGSPISKGIGFGKPVVFPSFDKEPQKQCIQEEQVAEEVKRFKKALALSRQDLEKLKKQAVQEKFTEIAAIIETHLQMIRDPMIAQEIEKKITEKRQATETVLYDFIKEYSNHFEALKGEYFQERLKDLQDISRRILGHLREHKKLSIHDLQKGSIILAHDLVPSETIEANSSTISAFITKRGGVTSHAAIVSRAKGIPYVANIDIDILQKQDIEKVIVDGSQGIVILNPTDHTIQKYEKLQKEYQNYESQLQKGAQLRSETIDGFEVKIFANLENPAEVYDIVKNGVAGVGLFRSEYLCFSQNTFPSEEEQFQTYKKMLQALDQKPLVIRIFDLGGDKKVEPLSTIGFFENTQEPNPALGCRAIRFLLRHPDILEKQLRAILRASVFGDVHILIPMIADIAEFHLVKEYIAQLSLVLKAEGIEVKEKIPIGCMIEVPSSAIMSDALVEEVDFLSIGTNDLIQYVLAADRTNPFTSDLYNTAHPSILRLIQMVVSHAKNVKKSVILCGELAADPMMIPILLGFGIYEFSVAFRHIPLVKETIRKWRIVEACRLAEGALALGSVAALKEYLTECKQMFFKEL